MTSSELDALGNRPKPGGALSTSCSTASGSFRAVTSDFETGTADVLDSIKFFRV